MMSQREMCREAKSALSYGQDGVQTKGQGVLRPARPGVKVFLGCAAVQERRYPLVFRTIIAPEDLGFFGLPPLVVLKQVSVASVVPLWCRFVNIQNFTL